MSAITGAARAWLPAARTRAAIAKRLAAASADMTTAALAQISARHPWFSELEAEHRSWVTLVARAGTNLQRFPHKISAILSYQLNPI